MGSDKIRSLATGCFWGGGWVAGVASFLCLGLKCNFMPD